MMMRPRLLGVALFFCASALRCSNPPPPGVDGGPDDGGACMPRVDAGPATCASAAWKPIFDHLDRSVLSAAADDHGNVYAVGGGLGAAGRGAIALRYDGSCWKELTTGRSETLWWVWAAPGAATDVWMVGEHGLILRYDGQRFTVVASSTTATLYGVWGSSPRDVWIVGGIPGAGRVDTNDVLLRWNGDTLARDTSVTAKGATFFKVWGSSAEDVWIAGEGGTLWRKQPSGWIAHGAALQTVSNVLTVHGCGPSDVWAVAGASIYQFDGVMWREVKGAPSGANGVSCGAASVLVVGNAGTKLRYERGTQTWFDHRRDEPWRTDFHGALVAPSGELWAVGGNFLLPASAGTRTGVIGYFGCR